MRALPLLCRAALLAAALPLHAAPAHQHGVAALNVAVEDDRLHVTLEAPLDSLVGFEHPARTPAEQHAVRDAAARLRDAATLFVTPAAARCRLESVRLASPAASPALLGETAATSAATPHAHAEAAGHADLDGEFHFRCAAPAALRGLEVNLFAAFPRLRTLDVQVAAGEHQRGARLTPAGRRLVW
ncbi:MAG: DUF2796 domain-containing protein [Candidatus Dactylopiibacterium sp.]|nr:DUF2796 domain-containing protein [Candidatus Dactylopiibacterium sp.]